MNNQEYYKQKQQKLQEKLAKVKDQYITDVINMTQRLVDEIKEIQIDNQEIDKITKDKK